MKIAPVAAALLFACCLPTSADAAKYAFPVPPLMETYDGKPVDSLETWEKVRRPEIREMFLTRMYGKRPAAAERPAVSFAAAEPDCEACGGKAVCKKVRITSKGPYGTHSFVVTAYVPKAARKVPVFVVLRNVDELKRFDPETGTKWPVEEIVARGYATVGFVNGDVAPETMNPSTAWLSGVFACYERPTDRTDESWATLSAWAWGESRIMDWIEAEPTLDARRVALVGHSRGGKTALLACATDERFAMACVNDSGTGGAKLAALDLPDSEYYAIFFASRLCYWFCGNFQRYCANHDRPPPQLDVWAKRFPLLVKPLGFDQHHLAALIAPRLLAIGSATDDPGAGPRGEFETAKLASPAWALYGKKGLVGTDYPEPDTAMQEGDVSYHLRAGKHDLASFDWARYMDFADRHGWNQ